MEFIPFLPRASTLFVGESVEGAVEHVVVEEDEGIEGLVLVEAATL